METGLSLAHSIAGRAHDPCTAQGHSRRLVALTEKLCSRSTKTFAVQCACRRPTQPSQSPTPIAAQTTPWVRRRRAASLLSPSRNRLIRPWPRFSQAVYVYAPAASSALLVCKQITLTLDTAGSGTSSTEIPIPGTCQEARTREV